VPRKAKSQSNPAEKARASWRGMLRFGLVSFPVEAFNAHSAQASKIALHQLHAPCHSRIRYQKTCPLHGPVETSEIVSGYEISKGKYIEISPEELEEMRTESERALTVDAFIDPVELDVIHFDGRMYYLSPDGDPAREPYAVFLEALRRRDCWGVGKVVFSGKEQVVIIRPYESALNMAMLNYEAEIRDPNDTVAPAVAVRGSDRKVQLAEKLIENWTEDSFDFSHYKDTHRESLKELIEAKAEGRELVAPEVEEEPQIINLTEALERSLGKRARSRATHAEKPHERSAAHSRKKSRTAS